MLSRYEIDKTIEILMNDRELQEALDKEDIVLSEGQFRNLAIALLDKKETINNNSIEELNKKVPTVARDDMHDIFNVDYISSKLYKQIMYTFKYSTIKIFFRENYKKFMPDYDFTVINSQEKMKLFTEAFMREYDRFASIIDEIYNVVDVDKAPEEYLNYLAQAVGYEREDNRLLSNLSFRELIKNIVEIYKIKGTNYSFELFFNFLGFQVELQEYWFDKRFSDPGITSNPETGVSNKKLFSFYLTSTKPTEYIPDGMNKPYAIPDSAIIGTLDVNEFNRKISQNEYTVEQLLGNESGFPGQPYTFFKTNVMQYALENIRTEEGEEGELSESDLETIERYANFLTPIFMQKNIVVSIKPFQDHAALLYLSDENREDPRSFRGFNESMFHFYQGYQPKNYYWNDGVHYYNESILRRDKEGKRTDISNPEGGGHFVSGFYKDTREKMNEIKEDTKNTFPHYSDTQINQLLSNRISYTYNRYYQHIQNRIEIVEGNNPGYTHQEILNATFDDLTDFYDEILLSIKNEVEYIYPYYTDEQIAEATLNRVYEKPIFDNFLAPRDLMFPYLENFSYAYSPRRYRDEFGASPLTYGSDFSFRKGEQKYFSEAYSERDNESRSMVYSIVQDNGDGNSVIRISQYSSLRYIKEGDTIKLFYSKNFKNDGIYDVLSSDKDGEYINIEIDGQVDSKQKTRGGFIQVYYEDWKIKNFRFPFMFDKVLDIRKSKFPFFLDELAMLKDYGLTKELIKKEPLLDLLFNRFYDKTIKLEYEPLDLKDKYEDNVALRYRSGFSFRKGDKKRFSEALNEETDGKTKIQSITLDDGDGNSVIYIHSIFAYRYLKENNTIKILNSKDFKNNGVYDILDIGEDGEYKTIKVDGKVNSGQKTSGGFIQIYYEDWKVEDFNFPFLFDHLLYINKSRQSFSFEDGFYNFDRDELEKTLARTREISTSFYSLNEYMEGIDEYRNFLDSSTESLTFTKLGKQDLKMKGVYEVTYDGTTYVRNSFDFYSVNPDFYWDYIDVVKT